MAGKRVSEIYGEIVWLLGQDPATRDLRISELERLVMPGILLRQFHIVYAKTGGSAGQTETSPPSDLQPVSVEVFALVDGEKANLLSELPRPLPVNAPLALTDWRSGTERVTVVSAALPAFKATS